MTARKDDKSTIIAISALGYILQDVLHEALGHGLTAWLSGAQKLTVSTVALQADIDTRWISANGTLVNLFFGAVFWFLLRKPQRYSPTLRYFLVVAMAGNLFSGTGYFFFSGFTNFGDWAAVVRGWEPYWLWRIALILVGVVTYYASMLLVGAHLTAFQPADSKSSARVRGLTFTAYFTDALVAFFGGLVNPLGLFYVIASALPSTLGANTGLIFLPNMIRGWLRGQKGPVEPIERSYAWIIGSAIASLIFIFVIGRGLTWQR